MISKQQFKKEKSRRYSIKIKTKKKEKRDSQKNSRF